MSSVIVSGYHGSSLLEVLLRAFGETQPQAVGLASAFVTVGGFAKVSTAVADSGAQRCRLVAGRDHAITHPQALRMAREAGWQVRLGTKRSGIFHPKLMVAGARFGRDGRLRGPSLAYVGSANLTESALSRNVECSLISAEPNWCSGASDAFAEIWRVAEPLTRRALGEYSAVFAKRNRSRSRRELAELGVSEEDTTGSAPTRALRQRRPPRTPAFETTFATTVWAELRSFTGDYAFQVEFPRAAGEVLAGMVRRAMRRSRIRVECEDDTVREMMFRYYSANSMYRLNVPRDVPGVDYARAHRTGLAVVRSGSRGGAPISLQVLPPGEEMQEVVGRSMALNTWGRTPTRLYGWF